MAPPPMAVGAAPLGSTMAIKPKPKPKKKTMPKKKVIKPKRKMKTLHWKPISDKKIIGTIWEGVSKIEDEIVADRAEDAFFAPPKEEEEEKDEKSTVNEEEKK